MWGVVEIQEAAPEDWEIMRDVRLDALRDAPDAFGSTYAREAAFTEAEWRGRFHDRGVTFFAYLGGAAGPAEPAGISGVIDVEGPAELVSMWVRPSARGQKVSEPLISACTAWAADRGHRELFLWVADSNPVARTLYDRHGFTPTGRTGTLRSNASLTVLQMVRAL